MAAILTETSAFETQHVVSGTHFIECSSNQQAHCLSPLPQSPRSHQAMRPKQSSIEVVGKTATSQHLTLQSPNYAMATERTEL